jgi:Kelch motif
MKSMNSARGTFSSIVSPNCNYIYAIGGFNGQPIDHVERYDVMHNNWEYLAPLK